MRELQFVGVAEDGEHLLLKDTAGGEKFLLPVDERLRAASRGDRSRLGQIELALDSPVRPREIQARIRAGETPEEVAAAAGAPLERVMRFAYPVLQERAQVAGEARRTRIRRSEFANRLGEQVDERLTRQGVDVESTVWDASRREDSIWWVTLTWPAGKKQQRAQWTFDLPGRALTPANDLAAELQAEQPKARRPFTAAPFVPPGLAAVDDRPAERGGAAEPPEQTRPAEPTDPAELAAPAASAQDRAAADPSTAAKRPAATAPAAKGTAATGPAAQEPAAQEPAAQEPAAHDVSAEDTGEGTADDGAPAVRPVTDLPARRAETAAHPAARETGAPERPDEPAAAPAEDPTPPAAPDSNHPAAAARPAAGKSRGRGRKAKVPAWEDIVFGARGPK